MHDTTGSPGAGRDEEAGPEPPAWVTASPMSAEETLAALETHAVGAARRAREKLAGPLGVDNLHIFLQAEECLRYPTVLQFDGVDLEQHQFAQPELVTIDGQTACILHVREQYQPELEKQPYIVAYMACAINYGTAATPHLCELYGSTLLDMHIDTFYDTVCHIADYGPQQQPGPEKPES